MNARRLHSTWPWLAATAALGACVALLTAVAWRRNDGQLVYALDDAYIHMAVARNVAEHGVWGVTPHGFSSSTSSLAWPALLSALFAAFGVAAWLPLALNLAFTALLLRSAQRILERSSERSRPGRTFGALLALAFLSGLSTVVLTGLEHVLHAWLALLFAFAAGEALAREAEPLRSARMLQLLALAASLPLVRFEGIAAVAVVSLLCALRGRWRAAAALALAALLPIAAYGAASAAHGWYWLPNSVVLKGTRPDWGDWQALADTFGYEAIRHLLRAPDLLTLLLACGTIFALRYRRRGAWEPRQVAAAVFAGCTLFQVQFAKTGNLYRYDLHLVVLGMLLVLGELVDASVRVRLPRFDARRIPRLAAGLLLLLVAVPFVVGRGAGSLVNGPRASANTYRQMVQMARFLERFYPGAPVATNDIGAVSYLGTPQLVDLAGLATMDVARLRLAKRYTPEAMRVLCAERGARVAVAYPGWYAKPPEWIEVGAWEVTSDVGLGARRVVFWALVPEEEAHLAQSLRAFSSELPSGVHESGAYLGPSR